jgi:hypothetical protein
MAVLFVLLRKIQALKKQALICVYVNEHLDFYAETPCARRFLNHGGHGGYGGNYGHEGIVIWVSCKMPVAGAVRDRCIHGDSGGDNAVRDAVV